MSKMSSVEFLWIICDVCSDASKTVHENINAASLNEGEDDLNLAGKMNTLMPEFRDLKSESMTFLFCTIQQGNK